MCFLGMGRLSATVNGNVWEVPMQVWVSCLGKAIVQGNCQVFEGSLSNRGKRFDHVLCLILVLAFALFSFNAFSQPTAPVRQAVLLFNTMSSDGAANAGAPQGTQGQGEAYKPPCLLLIEDGYVRGLALPLGRHFGLLMQGAKSGLSSVKNFLQKKHHKFAGLEEHVFSLNKDQVAIV